jgi:hypothetical protein
MRILIMLILGCCILVNSFAQNNAVYPQGNVFWNYQFVNYDAWPVHYSWDEVYWTEVDTVINGISYTTAASNGFARYDSQNDETFFYSNATQTEYNITRPATHQVGDTIDLTDIIRFLDHGHYQYLDFNFTANEINESTEEIQVLGVVTSVYSNSFISYRLNGFLFVNGVNAYNNNPSVIFGYVPGVGIHVFYEFSWISRRLICVYEEGEPIAGFDTYCVMDLNEFDVNQPLIYPNPANQDFQINLGTNDMARVSIWDASGSLVFSDREYQSGRKIQSSEFVSGFYTVRVEGHQQVYYLKLILN